MPNVFQFQPSFFSTNVHRKELPQFGEPALSYDPPYARPEDDQLAWLLVRYLHPSSELAHRTTIQATVGKVTLDFVVARGTYKAAFVVTDESEEAEGGPRSDAFWQSMALATGEVDVIYSISGDQVASRMMDALSVVAGWQPELFSPDGLAELAAAATPVSDRFSVLGTGAEVCLRYGAAIDDFYGGERFAWPESDRGEVFVRRRSAMRSASNSAVDLWAGGVGKVA